MTFVLFLFFFLSLVVFFSSFHLLLVLLYLEGLVILVLFIMSFLYYSWFTLMMFIVTSVCVGAYGVCLLISSSRSKGLNYFVFF